jgi:hypothetical protein
MVYDLPLTDMHLVEEKKGGWNDTYIPWHKLKKWGRLSEERRK